jgi:hypothetical protein
MRRLHGALCLSLGIGLLAIGLTENAISKKPAAAPVADAGKAAELASAVQIEPEALAKMLQASKGEKPVVLHVGFKNFYDQAKIPGSDYAGPGSKLEGLRAMGFTNVKVVHIADNFGANWVNPGLPVSKGE